MYSKHKEEKFVATEILFGLLSIKFQKTQYERNVFIDKVDDIVTKYSNAYHRATRMKHIDVRTSTVHLLMLKVMIKIPSSCENIKILVRKTFCY